MLFGLAAYALGAFVVLAPAVVTWRARPGRALVVLVAVWTLLTAPVYLFLFGVPYTAWLLTAARCGRLPAIATNFAAADSYALPGDLAYSGPGPFDSGYFCGALDAERAGYHRTPLR